MAEFKFSNLLDNKDLTNQGVSTLGQGISTLMLNSGMKTASRASAEAYRSQARMAIYQASQKNAYLNEELAGNVWQQYEQARIFMGAQNAAIGASGFADVSTGDKRLIADTIRKRDAAVDTMNRTAYLQAFETTRAAKMQEVYYNAMAKQQDIMSRFYSHNQAAGWMQTAAGVGQLVLSGMYSAPVGKDVKPTQGLGIAPGYDTGSQSVMGVQKPKMPWQL